MNQRKKNNKKAPTASKALSVGQKTRKSLTPRLIEDALQTVPTAMAAKQTFSHRDRTVHRIKNSELVASVPGFINFTTQSYYINPGLPATFPWLSTVADKFEQYRFKRLAFRYVTRSATSTAGSVIMSPDYNALDTPPQTEVEATDTQDAVEDSPWKEIICRLDVAAMFPHGPKKQVRSAAVPADLNLFDAGQMHICTVSFAADNTPAGKLWVDYEIELYVPQNSSISQVSKKLSIFGATGVLQGLASNTSEPLDKFTVTGSNPLNIVYDAGPDTFLLPAGVYRFFLQCAVIYTTAVAPSIDISWRDQVNALIPSSNSRYQQTVVGNATGITVPILWTGILVIDVNFGPIQADINSIFATGTANVSNHFLTFEVV